MSARGFGCPILYFRTGDVGPSIGSPTKLRRGKSVRRPVNEFRVGADRCVRPWLLDVLLLFKNRKRLCRGRLPRLPARADLRIAKWAGTEACPYDWLLEKQTAFGPSEGKTSYGFPVRADTAVRPYAEDLSIRANSAIVRLHKTPL